MKRRTAKKHSKENVHPSLECNSLSTTFSSAVLCLGLVGFRIFNSLFIRTWFVPDEFWQGPEVAHKLAFGYGYLTWEWKEGLRGFSFPLVFAVAFKILQLVGLDNRTAIMLIPRLLQAVLAGFGDFFLFKLSEKLFGKQSAKWSLLCNILSWFTFYSITRTLTNSTETVLTTIALYYWPWDLNLNKYKNCSIFLALLFAAVSCLVRPTSAVVWIPLGLFFLIESKEKILYIFTNVFLVGLLAMLWSVCVDSWFYGRMTIVQINFVMFNVVKDMGTFYGRHPWHWYFTQGFPVIIFTHLPLFFAGVFYANKRQRLLVLLIAWVMTVYSFLGHKEFRFILPILPLCMCYCGYFLNILEKDFTQSKTNKLPKYNWPLITVLILCITNIPLAVYTAVVHQKGVIDAMDSVYDESKQRSYYSVMFLMPCHSTPYYSYIHRNITMRFLECPPSNIPGYVDEADRFFLSPLGWLKTEYQNHEADSDRKQPLPTHLVFFDVLYEKIQKFLNRHKYTLCARHFHTHFPEGRIGKEVVIFCQKDK